MFQTSYTQNAPIGVHGTSAAGGGTLDVISVINGTTPLPAGSIVSYDADGKLALGGSASSVKVGMVLATRSNSTTAGTDTYKAGAVVPVTKDGRMYVTLPAGATDAAVGATPLYVIATGVVTATVGTGNGATTPLTNAIFETAGSAGEIVVVRLDT